MTAQEKFDQIVKDAKFFAPKFRTSYKSDSKFHTFIGKFLAKLGNKDYMSFYWTTIGQWCARPTICKNVALESEWKILAHEIQHAKDCHSLGFPLFAFIYLFPQILALFAILIPLLVLFGASTSLLWCLLGLLFILPFPALGRAYIEYRGYVVSLACEYWSGSLDPLFIDSVVKSFTNSNYYFMFPFKGTITWLFESKLKELQNGTFALDAYLALIKTRCFQYKTK
jgi:hypothetical protein